MDEVAKSVFTAPIATLFIIAGIVFLFIAVVGNISGKIEPGEKARIVSGVVGVAFIALGLAMHLLQKTPGVSESPSISSQSKPESTPSIQIPKQAPVLDNPPSQKQEILNSPLQTSINGVVVRIVRFEKRGEVVMLHLMARNISGQIRSVCFHSMQTTLIHEPTGESWKSKGYVGRDCSNVDVNNSSRIWMTFDIPEPENKIFSLSSPLFNGTLDNLVLTKSS